MISDATRAEIDRMPRQDLLLEVHKGRESRFQRESFAYLRTRLESLDKGAEAAFQDVQIAQASDSNSIARESNRTAKLALIVSIVSAAVAVLALLLSLRK